MNGAASSRPDRSDDILLRASLNETAEPKDPYGLSGIALSGGGIRSAAFNLGLIESLVKVGVFKRLDYMSTVSGGGYVGAMITAHKIVSDQNASNQKRFPYDPNSLDLNSQLRDHVKETCGYLLGPSIREVSELFLQYCKGFVWHLIILSTLSGFLFVPLLLLQSVGIDLRS